MSKFSDTVRQRMERYDAAMQPVYAAIDRAIREVGDPEAVREGVNGHLDWWDDEVGVHDS